MPPPNKNIKYNLGSSSQLLSSRSQSSLLHTQTQSTSKGALLEMIHVVRDSLNSAWTLHTKTKQKRLKQLLALEERVASMHDSCVETVLLHNTTERNGYCTGGGGGGSYKRRAKRHVSSAIQFLNVSTNSLRSDAATIGEDEEVVKCSIELDGFCMSSFLEEDEDEDEAKEDGVVEEEDGMDEEDEDVTVISSSFRTADDEDVGVSVTTWRRHSLGGGMGQTGKSATDTKTSPRSGILKRRLFANGSDSTLDQSFENGEKENEGKGDEESEDDDDKNNNDGTIEEIVVSMGDIVVRATRSKRVRFTGVKPTMEENLSRANELLRRARLRSTCSIASSTRAICGD